jgi:hypothetical protein
MQYSRINEEVPSVTVSQRITFFEYLFVLILIIYAGRANVIVQSLSFKTNVIGFLLPILLSGILVLRWKVKFDSRFFILILGFAIYFIAISIKYKEIRPTFFVSNCLIFFVVYSATRALKFNLFKIYEHLIFYLAIIGLSGWILQIGLRGDNLYYLLQKISGIDTFSYVSGDGLNTILYSVQPSYVSMLYGFAIPRNCGYAWEPGAFAVYICLAIFINLFFENSDNNSKKRFWILLITLISTQSTTGYLIFLVIILFYFLNNNLKIVLLILPFMIVSLIYIATLPFMSKKVIDLIDETKNVDLLIERTIGMEGEYTPQRFTSFVITFKDFKNNPVLGLGPHREDSWTVRLFSNISAISGIGELLSGFGLVGFLFFIIVSFKSSVFFSKYYNYKGGTLLFIIILFISISYSVIFLPLVMCFWMFQLFEPGEISKNTLGHGEKIVPKTE